MNDLFAVATHKLSDKSGSLFSRNHLAQDRADGRFKAIPSTRQSQPRKTTIESGEKRNGHKAVRDEDRIGIQVEHSPHATYDLKENLRVRSHNPELEFRRANHWLNLQESDGVADAKNPLEGIFRDAFNSRNRVRPVESNDGLPIVRRPKRKLELDAVFAADVYRRFS
jgi:hypothetical protein